MTDLDIVRGYVPEINTNGSHFSGEAPLNVGWLRLAELVVNDEEQIEPKVQLPYSNVPIGVEGTRDAWDFENSGFRGETPIEFVGIIALKNSVVRVEGIHYRSGARHGLAKVLKASQYDIDRYGIVLNIAESTNRRSATPRPNNTRKSTIARLLFPRN